MTVLAVVIIACLALLGAYLGYGRFVARQLLGLDCDTSTCAVSEDDTSGNDSIRRSVVLGRQSVSIAGAGSIIGSAIAVMWGWLPALLCVITGAVFFGAVRHLSALAVSHRGRDRSIGDIAGDLLGPRARLILLCVMIVGLWIGLAVFGLVIATVLRQYPAAVVPVLVQIPLAVVIGVLVPRKGTSIVIPSIVALALMYLSAAFSDAGMLGQFNEYLAAQPIWMWTAFLLAYAYVASVLPVWLLLQPRDYINAIQLITVLGLITVGLVAAAAFGGPALDSPAAPVFSVPPEVSSEFPKLEIVAPMIDWTPVGAQLTHGWSLIEWTPVGAPPLVPVLFITIACGACSGFHCLVGSGTTSKRIAKETDAKAVGYGSILTQGFLATLVIAACAAGIGMGATNTPTRWARGGWGQTLSSNLSEYEWVVSGDTLPIRTDRGDTSPQPHALLTGTTWHVIPGDPPLAKPVGVELRVLLLPETESANLRAFGAGPGERLFEIRMSDSEQNVDGEPVHEFSSVYLPILLETPSGSALLFPPFHDRVELPRFLSTERPMPSYWLTGPLAFDKQYENWPSADSLGKMVGAFVEGAANFVASLGIARDFAIALMALMVASLAAATMETTCRLQRHVVQELSRTFLPRRWSHDCDECGYDLSGHLSQGEKTSFGGHGPIQPDSSSMSSESSVVTCPECGTEHWAHEVYHDDNNKSWLAGSWFNPFKWLATVHGATIFAVLTAALLVAIPPHSAGWSFANEGQGALILWLLFGATSQLLAGFTLVVIIAWLLEKKRPKWFAIPPMVIMLIVPAAAMIWLAFIGNESNPSWFSQGNWLLLSIAGVTLSLELWFVIEAGIRFRRWRTLPDA